MIISNIMFSSASLAALLLFGVASCTQTLVNVASNKTVTMSTYYDDQFQNREPQAPGSHAVNGINNGQWYDGSCACTKRQQDPWLLLDLESSYTIVAMKIVNRADCCPERLKNLNFTFGPSTDEMTEIYYHAGTVGAVLDHEFDTPHTGQFLNISMDSLDYLTICGIELYEIGEPVNGSWTDWSDWTACSPTCGDGTESRSRTCTNPEPRYGGEDCEGDAVETRTCENPECPVDGGWTDFSDWSPCTHSCGIGMSTRSRSCTNPTPSGDGQECEGLATEMIVCNIEDCPPGEETGSNIDMCEPTLLPENCEDIRLSNPGDTSGTYTIYLDGGEIELEVYCDFCDERSYIYLSRSAIASIDTADLSKLYTRKDHALIRLLYSTGEQQSMEVYQLSSFQQQHKLSFQISEFQGYSPPINRLIKPFLYVGFQPNIAAPYTEPSQLVKNPLFGYRANGADVLFTNVDQKPNSFVAFYSNNSAFTSSHYYSEWSTNMPTVVPWYLYAPPVSTTRFLPEEYFLDYELRMGGAGGYATSFDGQQLFGIMGATVGFAYDHRPGCEPPPPPEPSR